MVDDNIVITINYFHFQLFKCIREYIHIYLKFNIQGCT